MKSPADSLSSAPPTGRSDRHLFMDRIRILWIKPALPCRSRRCSYRRMDERVRSDVVMRLSHDDRTIHFLPERPARERTEVRHVGSGRDDVRHIKTEPTMVQTIPRAKVQ